MARFLRDQMIKNITIDEKFIRKIGELFEKRANALQGIITFVIRFDGQGYCISSLDELLRYFDNANEVERIVFTLITPGYISSNGLSGAHIELKLDNRISNNCCLSVTSDEQDWVDATFSNIQNILIGSKNLSGCVSTFWT